MSRRVLSGRIKILAQAMSRELTQNILPFWLNVADPIYGGHYGYMDGAGRIDPTAPKSAVFVSRLLWTLATAGRALDHQRCLEQAARTKAFLLEHVLDRKHGGLVWSVHHDGGADEADKHVYAQAFGIYGLSAYAAVATDVEALDAAKALFHLLESRCRRPTGGYEEAFDESWQPVENTRLVEHGELGSLSMNTHIHLIEAYTGLSRSWPDEAPRAALRQLLELFLRRFLATSQTRSHQVLDRQLNPRPGPVSFGHDIEASWLIEAAGDAVGDADLSRRLRIAARAMAEYAAAAGQDKDGGFHTTDQSRAERQSSRLWWVQAEAVMGLVNAAWRGDDVEMMSRAEACWAFIEAAIVDRKGGDWFASADRRGRPYAKLPKIGPWKDPYHQARACLEVARLSAFTAGAMD